MSSESLRFRRGIVPFLFLKANDISHGTLHSSRTRKTEYISLQSLLPPIHLATVTNIISPKHRFAVSFLCLRIYSHSLFPIGSSLNLPARLSRTLITWFTVLIQFSFLVPPGQKARCQSGRPASCFTRSASSPRVFIS